MDPTIAQGLTVLGFTPAQIAQGGAIAAIAGFVVAHSMPYLPPPQQPTGFYAALYGLLNAVAGNYGLAANKES